MLSELGELCLFLGLGFAGAQTLGAFWGVLKSERRGEVLGQVSQLLSFGFLTLAFITLITAFVISDFSLYSVALHGHKDMPLLYRICAVWGHHEGSLLLWTLFSSALGVGFIFQLKDSPWLPRLLAIQGGLTFLFILFLSLSSNPFEKLPFLLTQGESLNPLLQDRALSFHPPILYLGYVGMASLYTFAVAALWKGSLDRTWIAALRPWALLAWGALTLGIAMGSWWAYYELGWGGWWFWDPVENASLIPWLSATAFLHTLRALETHTSLKLWTLVLGILTFGLCLLGTFLVRSGLITSVHAFALDPERGVWIFSILLLVMGLAVTLVILRGRNFVSSSPVSFAHVSGWMLLNTLILMLGLVTVLWGTFYPLILQSWNGAQISVGPPFYESTFVPLMMPLLLVMGALPWLFEKQKSSLSYGGVGALVFLILALFVMQPQSLMVLLSLTLLGWLFGGNLRWGNLTQMKIPGIFAHLGFGISILGMILSTVGKETTLVGLKEGASLPLNQYELTLQGVTGGKGPNYVFEEATLVLSQNGNFKGYLRPERRLYWPNNVPLHETAIWTNIASDVYVVLNEELPGGGRLIRATLYPWVSLIWIGCGIMALGVFVWVFSRLRLRSFRGLKTQTAVLLLSFILIGNLEASSPQARALFEEIRCPVCIGQSIADSGADVSIEIKSFIEKSLTEGLTPSEIKEKLMEKYGAQILLDPPLSPNTYALWALPFVLFLLITGGFVFRFLNLRQ